MAMMPPMAVVETQSFLASAARVGISETERTALIIYLAVNPEAGVVVPATGGIRKLRWALPGRGKSGGARVIYYYHNASIPLYALDIYAKNQKADLSAAEKRRRAERLPRSEPNTTGGSSRYADAIQTQS